MSSSPARRKDAEQSGAEFARRIVWQEGQGVLAAAERLNAQPVGAAIELIADCEGRLILSGIGKAGWIAQKLVATFASTGTPAQFLHPAEAVHGDLGFLRSDDVMLILSKSGETEEVLQLLPSLALEAVPLVAITSSASSRLGRAADIVLELGPTEEVCPHGLAPTTSTTVMLAIGDAVALAVSRRRGFQPRDFARLHPGGSLGRKLARVEEAMRDLKRCRVATCGQTIQQVFAAEHCTGRRTGALMLVDELGRLQGLFTDSDLARLIADEAGPRFDRRIEEVMTRSPKTVRVGAALPEAVRLLEDHKISELPVVDSEGRPVGMLDLTDLIGVPAARSDAGAASELRPTTLQIHQPNDPGGVA